MKENEPRCSVSNVNVVEKEAGGRGRGAEAGRKPGNAAKDMGFPDSQGAVHQGGGVGDPGMGTQRQEPGRRRGPGTAFVGSAAA